jgi:hypothetical protein
MNLHEIEAKEGDEEEFVNEEHYYYYRNFHRDKDAPAPTQISFKTQLLPRAPDLQDDTSGGRSLHNSKIDRNFADEPRAGRLVQYYLVNMSSYFITSISALSTKIPIASSEDTTELPNVVVDPPPHRSRRLVISFSEMSAQNIIYLVVGMVIMYVFMNATVMCLAWALLAVDQDDDGEKDDKAAKGYAVETVARRRSRTSRSDDYVVTSSNKIEEDVAIAVTDIEDQLNPYAVVAVEGEPDMPPEFAEPIGVVELHANEQQEPPKERLLQRPWTGMTLITVLPVNGTCPNPNVLGAIDDGSGVTANRRSSLAKTTDTIMLMASRQLSQLPDVVDNYNEEEIKLNCVTAAQQKPASA